MGRFACLVAWLAMLMGLSVSRRPRLPRKSRRRATRSATTDTTYAELAENPDAWTCNSTHWKDLRPGRLAALRRA